MQTYEQMRKEMRVKKLLSAIEWAPVISVPLQRRLEVFSAFTFISIVLFAELICLAIFVAIYVSFWNEFQCRM